MDSGHGFWRDFDYELEEYRQVRKGLLKERIYRGWVPKDVKSCKQGEIL